MHVIVGEMCSRAETTPAAARAGNTSPALPAVRAMDIDQATAFVRDNPRAVLATMRRAGTPQMSPVLVGVDEKNRLVISTRETAIKVANVRRDPRAWLCVLNDGFYGAWAQLGGDVEVVACRRRWSPSSSTTAASPESIPTGTTTGRPWFATAGASSASRRRPPDLRSSAEARLPRPTPQDAMAGSSSYGGRRSPIPKVLRDRVRGPWALSGAAAGPTLVVKSVMLRGTTERTGSERAVAG